MTEPPTNDQPSAGEILRRIAQVVAFAEGSTPEVRVGDSAELDSLDQMFPAGLPLALLDLYRESDPVSLTVPLAGEDIDFIPLSDIADVHSEEGLDPDLIPFARAGRTLICLKASPESAGGDGGVLALSRVGGAWEADPAASSLVNFLSVLAEVLNVLGLGTASRSGDPATAEPGGSALVAPSSSPELLITLENAVERIDPGHADFWIELVS